MVPCPTIREPDGLALLSSEPWCNEGGGGSSGTPEDFGRVDERFREINAALGRLARNRRTAVYVDAGHSAWQPLNDYDAGYGEPREQLGMASRLLRGGIELDRSAPHARFVARLRIFNPDGSEAEEIVFERDDWPFAAYTMYAHLVGDRCTEALGPGPIGVDPVPLRKDVGGGVSRHGELLGRLDVGCAGRRGSRSPPP